MAEALGIISASLGLVPILVEAIRGYRVLKETFRFIQSCTGDLNAISNELEVQETRFINECQLLLETASKEHDGRDTGAIATMVSDPEHVGWKDESLTGLLETYLGDSHSRSYVSCTKAINSMRKTQTKLEQQLATFDQIRIKRQSNEPFKSTYRRLRRTMSLRFNKENIEKTLERFKSANEDLEALHSQIMRLRSHKREITVDSSTRPLPKDVCRTHEMAMEAYSALSSTFTCKEISHTQHWAALCMEQEVIDSETLKLALSYVVTMDGSHNEHCVQICLRSSKVANTASTKRDIDPPMKPKRKKKLRFFGDDDEDSTAVQDMQTESVPPNLSSMQDICNFLGEKCNQAISATGFRTYLGYLQASCTCRHIFYVSPSIPLPPYPAEAIPLMGRNPSLKDLFGAVAVNQVTLHYQLSWAIKLALAVLQFHSTPWLQDEWRTSDLLLPALDPSTAVKPSLLLRASLPTRIIESVANTAMKDSTSDTSNAAEDEEYGIYNRPLWGLGVALLEVGHWKSLDEMQDPLGPDLSETRAVRRLSKELTELGSAYNQIARICLQCNFGCANDMSTPELQNAVYAKVVCPLMKMKEVIEKLDQFDLKVRLP